MATAGKNAYLRLRQAVMACTSLACRSQLLLWLNLRSTESPLQGLERVLKSHIAKHCTLLSAQAAHLRSHLAAFTELARAADLTTGQVKNPAMDSADLVEAMCLSQPLPTENLLQACLAGDETEEKSLGCLFARMISADVHASGGSLRPFESLVTSLISEATTFRPLDGAAIPLPRWLFSEEGSFHMRLQLCNIQPDARDTESRCREAGK